MPDYKDFSLVLDVSRQCEGNIWFEIICDTIKRPQTFKYPNSISIANLTKGFSI